MATPLAGLTTSEYDDFVQEVRFPEPSNFNWRRDRAALIGCEVLEALGQHGPSSLLLMPRGDFDQILPDSKLVYGMADEFSDILWFSSYIVRQLGSSTGRAATEALRAHVPAHTDVIKTFREVGDISIRHASDITVPNKWGMPSALALNPYYSFMRHAGRLIFSLNPEGPLGGPPTATHLEGPQDSLQAAGDLLLTLAFIAEDRLGMTLEDIAVFNMRKLRNRLVAGKSNDVKFGPEDIISKKHAL